MTTALATTTQQVDYPAILSLIDRMGAASVLPKHLTHDDRRQLLPPDVVRANLTAVVVAGVELGLTPMQSLRSMYLVEGRVVISSEAQLAMMGRAGVVHRWVRSDETLAVLELQREGRPPHREEWSMEDARRAGLAGKNNWKSHPRAMLRARCVTAAARAYCPDVVLGLVDPDEVQEIPTFEAEAPEVAEALRQEDATRTGDARDAFVGQLDAIGWTLDQLTEFLAWRARQEGRDVPPHPGRMSDQGRERLLVWLQTDEARGSYRAFSASLDGDVIDADASADGGEE